MALYFYLCLGSIAFLELSAHMTDEYNDLKLRNRAVRIIFSLTLNFDFRISILQLTGYINKGNDGIKVKGSK